MTSNICRVKKGRIRICHAGSSQQHRIVILYISDTPRKAGDVHNPYAVLTRLVLSGKFDEVLASLGVRRQRRLIGLSCRLLFRVSPDGPGAGLLAGRLPGSACDVGQRKIQQVHQARRGNDG